MSIEVMKQALEALEWDADYDTSVTLQKAAITALRQAIAEAERQEPVAFVSKCNDGECLISLINPAAVFYTAPVHASDISQERVDETPKCKDDPRAPHGFDRNASHCADRYVCECEGWEPPKEWVGLTQEETQYLVKHFDWRQSADHFVALIEVRLKEKNCG